MGLNTESSAALVFLILYAILFALMLLGYLTGRIRFRSRYTVVFLHVLVRLASQSTGLAFGIIGYSNTNLLVAYFILGAEGYFTLVLCTYRFLISWHYHNNASHDSWIEPRHPPGTPLSKRFLDSFKLFQKPVRPMPIMHNMLVAANAIIIAGGSLLAGDTPEQFSKAFPTARAMRLAGQSIFLSVNVFLLFCIFDSIRQYKREHPGSGRVHPTLYILLATWPFLFVRGLYGILSSVVPLFNYFSPNNYGADGLTDRFVISEYILSTTMEWTSCALLLATYLSSRRDPKKGDIKEWGDVGKETANGC